MKQKVVLNAYQKWSWQHLVIRFVTKIQYGFIQPVVICPLKKHLVTKRNERSMRHAHLKLYNPLGTVKNLFSYSIVTNEHID